MIYRKALYLLFSSLILSSCAINSDDWVVPNYDDAVGKHFSTTVYDWKYFKMVDESNGTIVYKQVNPINGCSTNFGVRKVDETILYWRVEPSPESCMVRTHPLNR